LFYFAGVSFSAECPLGATTWPGYRTINDSLRGEFDQHTNSCNTCRNPRLPRNIDLRFFLLIAIHSAVVCGDVNWLKILLRQDTEIGVNSFIYPNRMLYQDETYFPSVLLQKHKELCMHGSGNVLLSLATKPEVYKFLLKQGSNFELASENGVTPLLEACARKNEQIVKMLLKKGANVEAEDAAGKTAVHKAASNYSNGMKILDLLIEKKVDLNRKDVSGSTALHDACSNKYYVGIIHKLIENGANVDAIDGQWNTPLSYAVLFNDLNATKILLEKGCKTDYLNLNMESPLQLASRNEYSDIVAAIKNRHQSPENHRDSQRIRVPHLLEINLASD
jgi:hypothetical protein